MYGVVSLVDGKPVMTLKEDANSAVGYAIPLKMRKQDLKKQVDSYITSTSTVVGSPEPQQMLTVDNDKLEKYRKMC